MHMEQGLLIISILFFTIGAIELISAGVVLWKAEQIKEDVNGL